MTGVTREIPGPCIDYELVETHRAASGAMRITLEQERSLTEIGNQMQIRQFETGKAALSDIDVDYLFIRMSRFVFHVHAQRPSGAAVRPR